MHVSAFVAGDFDDDEDVSRTDFVTESFSSSLMDGEEDGVEERRRLNDDMGGQRKFLPSILAPSGG